MTAQFIINLIYDEIQNYFLYSGDILNSTSSFIHEDYMVCYLNCPSVLILTMPLRIQLALHDTYSVHLHIF